LTFNKPVYALSVDFLLVIAEFNDSGYLQLDVGGELINSARSVGVAGFPNDQYGTLTYSSATPFTSVTLQGLQPGFKNDPPIGTEFSIDNLGLTEPTPDSPPGSGGSPESTPEPASLALLGIGLGAVAVTRKRRRG
jgi:PEP-CTERM motif